MENGISNKITENQYMAIVQSSMIAIRILTLAKSVSEYAYQQGWLVIIIAGIYPMIIVLAAAFIDKKMDGKSFEEINDNIYGKFLSKIILLIFSIVFIYYESSVISGFINAVHKIIVLFRSPYIILGLVFLVTIYTTINGLTLIGRLCELVFYLVIILMIMTLSLSFKGTITNVMPFFSSFKDILAALPDSIYSYGGVELSYLVISFISNKKNPKRTGIYSTLIVIFAYASNVFITIYCLGWEITSKYSYPILYLTSTVEIPLIENVRTILLVIWSFVILRILACQLFGASYCLSKALKISYKKSSIVAIILSASFSVFLIPEYNREKILSKLVPYVALFGVLWGIITAIIILFKRKHSNKG